MTTDISLNHITKIEGHASLTVSIDRGVVKRCELGSVEGSRYFEGMLKGRMYNEASEMTSRICGICSCAHTIAAITAVENALGVKPSEQTMLLRLLLTLGERIRSHPTHLYFLALPDYLGYESALAMLPKFKAEVERALRMTKVGNSIVNTIGGRDLHPVSATVGGFLKLPTGEQIAQIRKDLLGIKEDATAMARLFAGLKYPDFEMKSEQLSLTSRHGYATLSGDVKVGSHVFGQKDYKSFIEEYHERHSTANFAVREGKAYMVGSLARVNNNFEFLSEDAKKAVEESGIRFPNSNIFVNNFAQAIETIHCIDEAIAVCDRLETKEQGVEPVKIRAGRGIGAIEVPRGTLWHEYELDDEGRITYANIITPTTQNLRSMQDSIRDYLGRILSLPKESIVIEIEKLIRAYDPCFSCSTHFLEVKFV